jgi:hypothetical protein
MEIRRNPVNAEGQQSTPVVWEMNCLEQVCGICTMIINGTVRQSCSALVDKLDQPISLEPMTKFPNVRDLVVDRAEMFEHLKRIKAWIEIDGTHDLGPGPRMSQEDCGAVYLLALLYLRVLFGSLPAVRRWELDRRTDAHAIQTFRHASDRQDVARRTPRRHHGRRRYPELQQLKQLRACVPDVHSDDESDLRGEPRHRSSRLARLAQAMNSCRT